MKTLLQRPRGPLLYGLTQMLCSKCIRYVRSQQTLQRPARSLWDKSPKRDTAAATQRIELLHKCTAATQKTALIRETFLDEDTAASTQRTALYNKNV